MLANEIELFKNLSEIEFEKEFFDFHNDFDFQKLLLESEKLLLFFKNIETELLVALKFEKVIITKIEFFNDSNTEFLTIDNIYRGRVEIEGELNEFLDKEQGYFYLEFYEGQKLEFWAKELMLTKLNQ